MIRPRAEVATDAEVKKREFCLKDKRLCVSPRALKPTSFTRGLSEERLDDFLDIRALAFGALWLLRVVLLNGTHFTKFLVAITANVFVEGHKRTSG